jgi:hypothetical protein
MNAATMQAMLCMLLAVIAIATFVLKGKQWPTFISAGLLGLFLGATNFGNTAVESMAGMFVALLQNLTA